MKKLNLLYSLMFILFGTGLSGQVTNVNYQMKYDTSTCRYDCYLIVNSGQATAVPDRIQLNAQYSIVVPTGTTLSIDSNYMPLVANEFYSSTTPIAWSISTVVQAPAAQPESDFYSITPQLTPTSHYNNLISGDTVKLFSVAVDTIYNCSEGIRLYENGVDPSSSDAGMQSSDFSQGYTMGTSYFQIYNANSTQVFPPKPLISDISNACSEGIEIDLTASTPDCQGPLTYVWTGPAGDTVSLVEDVSLPTSTAADNGWYNVVITDAFGCITTDSIIATSKPDAGIDQIACAGDTKTVAGTPTTGTWFALGTNPTGATLSPLANGEAQIDFDFTASGTYLYEYSIPGCTDTMEIFVNPQPVVAITGDNGICVGETTTLSPTTGGTWVSNTPAVATVTNAGVVTAVATGTATFTFTNTLTGCTATTPPVTVNDQPIVANTGSDTLCITSTTNLTPGTGGTWTSSAPAVATVTNAGLVTGVAAGTAKMYFLETATGCTSDTITIVVEDKPVVSVPLTEICVNGVMTVTPSSGGTWTSSDPLVATITNAGLVLGLTPGTVTFTFTSLTSGCVSDPTEVVTVVAAPIVSITGDNQICIETTSSVSPTTGGTWTSSDNNIATVTDAGVVTAVAQGVATFTFTNTATGCTATTAGLIVDPRPTANSSADAICIGSTTTLNPSIGGTWAAVTPGFASVTLGNLVTGIAEGEAMFLFTETGSGCVSDTVKVDVEPGPVVSITGDDDICAGFTTTLSPTSGGIWTSNNPSIASVTNAGLVTGIAAGTATFTFTSGSTLCNSAPTAPVTVRARPLVEITGATQICIGATSSVSPTTGGTWVSSDDGIATITNAGVVTAVSPGSATFTFTNTSTGCESLETEPMTINEIPALSLDVDEICVGFNAQASPSTGGIWSSDDEAVATITNAGLVTGEGAGTATLTYTNTNTGCVNTIDITINEAPTVSVTGDDELCIGETSQLSPTTGGVWSVSVGSGVASVTNAGVVTALAAGTVRFEFTSDDGCVSEETDGIVVNGAPTVTVDGATEICIGSTTTLLPSSNGTWASNDVAIATVTNAGVVTGVAAGDVTFVFTDTITGCVSAPTEAVTILPRPVTNLEDSNICIGQTTSISPFIGGTWSSSAPSVATISNDGLITAEGEGFAILTFTSSEGCMSDGLDTVFVDPGPDVTIDESELCITETANLTPTTGGTWESSDVTVATVTDAGVVTATGAGLAYFQFTEDATGCKSNHTDTITVHPAPTISIGGTDVICITGTTTMLPDGTDAATLGTWVSSDDAIATIANDGTVTGVAVGSATFVFTLTATGCPSDASEPIEVSPTPTALIIGLDSICIGSQTTLSPSTGGIWTSSDESVATVTNGGVVTSIAPGVVNFSFTETATGCASSASTDDVVVFQCIDPDFNATFVDIEIGGDVSTNDFIPLDGGEPLDVAYGNNYTTTSTPSGAVVQLTINPDGTYTFEGNTVGEYVFEVPVCVEPLTSGCGTSELTINVVDYQDPINRPVANVDIATTDVATAVTLYTVANDRCVVVNECDLDATSVAILTDPNYGSATVDAISGDITYTPNALFTGIDTLEYEVCVVAEAANCSSAFQIITVNAGTALNSTVAADDFGVTPQETVLTGDVSTNDNDIEGDAQTVTAQTTSVAAGTLVLATDGTYTFTPAEWFFGSVDFPYTTTDDNVNPAEADATLHIIVVRDLTIKIRVYVEGALIHSGSDKGTTHTRKLMTDHLRESPFTGANYIPTSDPYKYAGTPIGDPAAAAGGNFVDITARYDHVGLGDQTEFGTIPDPSTVFAVTGEDAITDWVYVELRDKTTNTTIHNTRPALLQRDGDVVDLDGIHGLKFPGMDVDDYYVVVRHRNHLGAMTAVAQTPEQLFELVDFTAATVDNGAIVATMATYDHGEKDYGFGVSIDFTGLGQKAIYLPTGPVMALWAGDFDGNKKVKFESPFDDLNNLSIEVKYYPGNTTFNSNFDFAYGYLNSDIDMNGKAKFDNPNDDNNILSVQVKYHRLNSSYLSNFDFVREQMPENN